MTKSSGSHAIQRAQERYGITLTAEHLRRMVAQIKVGCTLRMRQHSDGCETHAVRIEDIVVRAVYDPRMDKIMTILPPGRKKRMSRRLKAGRSGRSTVRDQDIGE